MLPPYMCVDRESKAAQWTGVPSAVYKLDFGGLSELDADGRERAIACILDWMSAYENDHDAWVLTPSQYMFAMDAACDGDTGPSKQGSCIGNCIMPVRYTMMDSETSRRCMLTCADGAPFEEYQFKKDDWVAFANNVFYRKEDKRRSCNGLFQMLMSVDLEIDGPVMITCF